jgi:hypothetical protein
LAGLPTLSYLTLLDKFVLGSIFFLVLMALENFVVGRSAPPSLGSASTNQARSLLADRQPVHGLMVVCRFGKSFDQHFGLNHEEIDGHLLLGWASAWALFLLVNILWWIVVFRRNVGTGTHDASPTNWRAQKRPSIPINERLLLGLQLQ